MGFFRGLFGKSVHGTGQFANPDCTYCNGTGRIGGKRSFLYRDPSDVYIPCGCAAQNIRNWQELAAQREREEIRKHNEALTEWRESGRSDIADEFAPIELRDDLVELSPEEWQRRHEAAKARADEWDEQTGNPVDIVMGRNYACCRYKTCRCGQQRKWQEGDPSPIQLFGD